MKEAKMNSAIILEGEKVRLRPICDADTPLIVKWRNLPEIKNCFIFRDTLTENMHREWMKKVKSGEVVQYIIEYKETGISVGSVYFRDIDKKNNSAEYGIFIGESDAKGKGLGTEATRIFVNYGLEVLKLHRILLRVLSNNENAICSYEKAGFAHEGCFKDMVFLDNRYQDIVFMAILKKNE